jgi:hypothetical protein
MPRKKLGPEERRPLFGGLAKELAQELKSANEAGQPMIYEKSFPTGALRVLVFWDKWDHIPFEERASVILRAYDLAEGQGSRDKIALVNGLTIPEAHAAGMLPFQILAAWRKGDPVTLAQCREAMLAEGASTLVNQDAIQLRFPTEEDAEACKARLSQRLPGSEPVWLINRDLQAQDFSVDEP